MEQTTVKNALFVALAILIVIFFIFLAIYYLKILSIVTITK